MLFGILDLFILVAGIVVFLYIYSIWEDGILQRKGVKSLPLKIPILGHTANVLTFREHFMVFLTRLYQTFPDQKYVGFRQLTSSILMIRDIELMKQLTVKDFDHFQDHRSFADPHNDPLFGNNLFSMQGKKWRDMRATLSPAFTTSKMKNMFLFIRECSQQTTNFFIKAMDDKINSERGYVELELKDTFARYGTDVIASSAFGIRVDSLAEPKNEFFQKGKMAANFSGIQLLKFFVNSAFPAIAKGFGITISNIGVVNFFRSLIINSMTEREQKKIIRPDMIHLLMEARKGTLKDEPNSKQIVHEEYAVTPEFSAGYVSGIKRNWSDDEIAAQAMLFFIAGYEGSSTSLCFVMYELAFAPDVQEKLQEEIDGVCERCPGGEVTYTELQSMKYLDMVISESLRLWPPAPSMDRKCVKPYILPPPSDAPEAKPYSMAVGDILFVPIYSIHHDPDFFPDPKKFDPDRFSSENISNIKPGTYIPFGYGPRNCIASRFALMETKAIVFHVLSKFNCIPTAKTARPLQMMTNTFNLVSKDAFWLGLQPRKQKLGQHL